MGDLDKKREISITAPLLSNETLIDFVISIQLSYLLWPNGELL